MNLDQRLITQPGFHGVPPSGVNAALIGFHPVFQYDRPWEFPSDRRFGWSGFRLSFGLRLGRGVGNKLGLAGPDQFAGDLQEGERGIVEPPPEAVERLGPFRDQFPNPGGEGRECLIGGPLQGFGFALQPALHAAPRFVDGEVVVAFGDALHEQVGAVAFDFVLLIERQGRFLHDPEGEGAFRG
jgi:hypothetical protein